MLINHFIPGEGCHASSHGDRLPRTDAPKITQQRVSVVNGRAHGVGLALVFPTPYCFLLLQL